MAGTRKCRYPGLVLAAAVLIMGPAALAQEHEFEVLSKSLSAKKVAETASNYAEVLQFDVKGSVKDNLITGLLEVIVPKGHMTPSEILTENIFGIITIGAGPQYLILKELLISENRRKAVLKGIHQSIEIMGEMVSRGTPALNQGSKFVKEVMNPGMRSTAEVMAEIGEAFRNAVGPERRLYDRLRKVILSRGPTLSGKNLRRWAWWIQARGKDGKMGRVSRPINFPVPIPPTAIGSRWRPNRRPPHRRF